MTEKHKNNMVHHGTSPGCRLYPPAEFLENAMAREREREREMYIYIYMHIIIYIYILYIYVYIR